jgi:hypothetical protein
VIELAEMAAEFTNKHIPADSPNWNEVFAVVFDQLVRASAKGIYV